jgi:hypothetical protein
MGKINLGRVILGGIVAGIVFNVLDFPVDGVWLSKLWSSQLSAFGAPGLGTRQLLWFNVLGIIGGIVAVWIYASIRPRFGPGVRTAIYAGVVVWFLAFLMNNFAWMWVTFPFTGPLMVYTTVGAFFEVVIGTIAGAALYKEA